MSDDPGMSRTKDRVDSNCLFASLAYLVLLGTAALAGAILFPWGVLNLSWSLFGKDLMDGVEGPLIFIFLVAAGPVVWVSSSIWAIKTLCRGQLPGKDPDDTWKPYGE